MQDRVGTIECRWCGNPEADVGRDKGKKLYVVCDCGQHFLRTHIGQRVIRQQMRALEVLADPPVDSPADPPADPPGGRRRAPAAPPADPPAPDDPEPKARKRERSGNTLIG